MNVIIFLKTSQCQLPKLTKSKLSAIINIRYAFVYQIILQRGNLIMKKHYNATSVKDILISCADKLPENLMIDAVDDHGKFSIDFISRLTDDQLIKLSEEASKKADKTVFLEFSTVTEDSTDCPYELKKFSDFDWYKVCQIKISGDTCPYIHSIHSEPHHYISVVFVVKN